MHSKAFEKRKETENILLLIAELTTYKITRQGEQ